MGVGIAIANLFTPGDMLTNHWKRSRARCMHLCAHNKKQRVLIVVGLLDNMALLTRSKTHLVTNPASISILFSQSGSVVRPPQSGSSLADTFPRCTTYCKINSLARQSDLRGVYLFKSYSFTIHLVNYWKRPQSEHQRLNPRSTPMKVL
jgi:hypothetical protein